MRAEAEALLRVLTGREDARFRPGQWEAIERLVEQRRRVLVVQRTGWGKSAVYFVATRLLRDRGAGPTLLVSPLLALMRNQIEMGTRAGVHTESINSANTDDWERVEDLLRSGAVDLLLVSPERLNNVRFRRDVLPSLVQQVGLMVVDEAHCISDWGHDFRPDYRRIARVLDRLPRTVPVLCTTATANDRVVGDIVEQLGDDLAVVRGSLERESLAAAVLDLQNPAERLAWLAETIPNLPGSGIVYCLTVGDTERVATWLRARGIDAVAYSGESEDDHRIATEQRLLAGDVKVVVATSALGMGFDMPDLAFVVHYQSPGSPIAYYQQVGRAGRALEHAPAILLRGSEDAAIQDYFIRTAFPPREQAEAVVDLLARSEGPVPITLIEREVNARRSRIEAMLKVLEVEGAVERHERGWCRTPQPWAYDGERVARVTEARRAEQRAMEAYATAAGCRMEFLRRQLDDPEAAPCGRCDNCTGAAPAVAPPPAVVAAARAHLRGGVIEIEPRRQWPARLDEVSGRIEPARQCCPGRALGVYGDGGWGSDVRDAKYRGEQYPDPLVEAAAALVRKWAPCPPPEWVTGVPSTSSGDLAAGFARRLADRIGLPFHAAVVRTRPGRPQAEMDNSAQQCRNVLGAFATAGDVPPSPVLLVDDVVHSRWTLTVVGAALRDAGSGPVHPLVLAFELGGTP